MLKRVGPVRYGPNRLRSLLIGYLGEWAAYQWAHRDADSGLALPTWLQGHTRPGRRDDGGDIKLSVNDNGRQVIEVRSRPISRPPIRDDTFDIAARRIPPPNRDIMLFVCVHNSLTHAFLVGWLTRDEWLDLSHPIFPGQLLAYSSRVAETTNISIRLSLLHSMEELHCSSS
jgi:hypothetical protein